MEVEPLVVGRVDPRHDATRAPEALGEPKPNQKLYSSQKSMPKMPTRAEFARMSQEEIEAWQAAYLLDQKRIFENFDADKIERDPIVLNHLDASLTWRNVSFGISVPDPKDDSRTIDKVLLEKCNGCVEPGSLVAVMGPSGCGKSTLLDIIAQKKTAPHQGDIYLNGNSVRGDPLMRRISAYVGQEDLMPEHWTARQAVEFNARLKKALGSNITQEMMDRMVDGILDDVGLLHVANTKIGGPSVRGLSGGQKRRVTLARGMSASPRILFCDEPTSGLSATDADHCIKALKVMSLKFGITILVVIHQPRVEVARLFTHLIALTAQPGRVVYNGLMTDVAAHCNDVKYPVPKGAIFCDHFMDIITPGAPGAVPDTFRDFYVKNIMPLVEGTCDASLKNPGKTIMEILEAEREMTLSFTDVPPIKRTQYGSSFCTQMTILGKREITLALSDPSVFGMIIVQIVLGLVIGVIYFGVGEKEPKGMAQLGYFFIVINMATLAPVIAMPGYIQTRHIVKLEVFEALYSEGAWMISFLLFRTLISLAGLTLMVVIMFAMGKMPWGSFGNIYYWGLLNFLMLDAMVGLGTAAAKNMEQANYYLMPFQFFAGLFNGFALTKVSSPPFLKWIFYISPAAYSLEDIAHFNYGDDPVVWGELKTYNGLEWHDHTPVLGTVLTLAIVVVGRTGQVLALKYLNRVQK